MLGPTVRGCDGRGWSRSGSSPSSWRWLPARLAVGRQPARAGVRRSRSRVWASRCLTTVLGVVVAWRVPDNPVGVLLTWVGGLVVFFSALDVYYTCAGPTPARCLSTTGWSPRSTRAPGGCSPPSRCCCSTSRTASCPVRRWRLVPPHWLASARRSRPTGRWASSRSWQPMQDLPRPWGAPVAVEVLATSALLRWLRWSWRRRLAGRPLPAGLGARAPSSSGCRWPVWRPSLYPSSAWPGSWSRDDRRGAGRWHRRAGRAAGVRGGRDAAPRPVRRRPGARRHHQLRGVVAVLLAT